MSYKESLDEYVNPDALLEQLFKEYFDGSDISETIKLLNEKLSNTDAYHFEQIISVERAGDKASVLVSLCYKTQGKIRQRKNRKFIYLFVLFNNKIISRSKQSLDEKELGSIVH